MSSKIGFFIKHLSNAQMSISLIDNVNKLNAQQSKYVPYVFYQEQLRMLVRPYNFFLTQQVESFNFDGPIITTCLDTAAFALQSPQATDIFLYMWNLEWLYEPNFTYSEMATIYNNKRIKLIVRNKNHYNIVKNLWQTPVAEIENFNYEQLIKVISG